MRLKRVHVPTGNTAGKAFTRRTPWWQVISASTVAAFALAVVVTAVATGGFTAAAQPVDSASRAPAALGTGVISQALKPYLTPPLLKAVPVGPGPVSKPVLNVLTSPVLTTTLDSSGIPVVALEAYQRAANALAVSDPGCHLPWQLLAAIGRVESDDGQFAGTVLLPDGNTSQPIYGIPLDGVDGVALVLNTNQSEVELDGGSNYARAVGPMQFLPSTWLEYGADANGDGDKDPNNIFDAALAAADYLCADGGDMANPAQEAAAVLRYNDADQYVRVVLALAASYELGDYATVPTSGPVGTVNNGGGSAPGTASLPQTNPPAATRPPPRLQHRSPRRRRARRQQRPRPSTRRRHRPNVRARNRLRRWHRPRPRRRPRRPKPRLRRRASPARLPCRRPPRRSTPARPWTLAGRRRCDRWSSSCSTRRRRPPSRYDRTPRRSRLRSALNPPEDGTEPQPTSLIRTGFQRRLGSAGAAFTTIRSSQILTAESPSMPAAPSVCSRRMSACPACRAVSSIMWT
jgi:membrane-bound lytic murein transglycosylase B